MNRMHWMRGNISAISCTNPNYRTNHRGANSCSNSRNIRQINSRYVQLLNTNTINKRTFTTSAKSSNKSKDKSKKNNSDEVKEYWTLNVEEQRKNEQLMSKPQSNKGEQEGMYTPFKGNKWVESKTQELGKSTLIRCLFS